LFVWVFITQEA